MAFTSAWAWETIDKGFDYTSGNNTIRQRASWSLTRFRYSDEAFSSSAGTTTTSAIAAFRGGTETSVSLPKGQRLRFGTTQNWVHSSADWVTTGRLVCGLETFVYAPGITLRRPNAQSTLIATPIMTDGWMSWGPRYRLAVVEASPEEALGAFRYDFPGNSEAWGHEQMASHYSGGITNTPRLREDGPYPSWGAVTGGSDWGYWLAVQWGGFTGSSTPSISTNQSVHRFYCASDQQQWQNNVPWYKQTQTWEYLGPWGVV